MSEPWAAAHRIPPADYQARFDALYRLGFRLTWVQAYGSAAGPRFNAVWVRRAGAPALPRCSISAAPGATEALSRFALGD